MRFSLVPAAAAPGSGHPGLPHLGSGVLEMVRDGVSGKVLGSPSPAPTSLPGQAAAHGVLSPWGSRDEKMDNSRVPERLSSARLLGSRLTRPIAVARSPRTLAHSSPSSPGMGNPWVPSQTPRSPPPALEPGPAKAAGGPLRKPPQSQHLPHLPRGVASLCPHLLGWAFRALHVPSPWTSPDPLPLSGTSHPGCALGHLRLHLLWTSCCLHPKVPMTEGLRDSTGSPVVLHWGGVGKVGAGVSPKPSPAALTSEPGLQPHPQASSLAPFPKPPCLSPLSWTRISGRGKNSRADVGAPGPTLGLRPGLRCVVPQFPHLQTGTASPACRARGALRPSSSMFSRR